MTTAFQHVQFVCVSLLLLFLVMEAARAVVRDRPWRRLSGSELAALAACLLLALSVRLGATVFPADHSLASTQGSTIGGVHRWAAGYSAVLHFLYLFLPSDVATAAAFNTVVSTLTVLAVFAFAEAYFEDRLAAFAAAAVLAAGPVSARYAASDSAHVLLTFCLFAGCFFLTLWSRGGRGATLLQGAGWLAAAANVRFEACAYVLVGPLILFGAGRRLGKGDRAALLQAGAVYLFFVVCPFLSAVTDVSGGHAETFSLWGVFGYFFRSPYSSAAVAVVAVAGLLLVLAKEPRRTLAFLGVISVVSLPTVFEVFPRYDVAHRYVLPHLAAWGVFAGLGASAALGLLSRSPRVTPLRAAAVLAAVLLAAAPHRGFLRKMWTFAREYDFIVERLRDVPESCVMVQTDDSRDDESRSLRIGSPLSAEAGKGHAWRLAAEVLASGSIEHCTMFYAGVACYAYEPSRHAQAKADWDGAERPICRRMRERFDLEPVAEALLPTIPYQDEAYTASPVPIGLYRLREKATSRQGLLAPQPRRQASREAAQAAARRLEVR